MMGRGGHPPWRLMVLLAVGCTPGMGPATPTGPSRDSGVGVILHELHVSIHHLPHQLLQGGREADEAPSAGDEQAGCRERPRAQEGPLAPRSRTRRGRGFAGLFLQWPWPQGMYQGCPVLPWGLLSSKEESGQGQLHFLVSPRHPT